MRHRSTTGRLASAAIAALVLGATGCSEDSRTPTGPSPVGAAAATAGAAGEHGGYAPDAGGWPGAASGPATGSADPGPNERIEIPTIGSTGLDRANLPAGLSPQEALRALTTTLDGYRFSAARMTRPSKPEFTSVDVSPGSVATEWTESTAPNGETLEHYELKFQALAGTGTDLTERIAHTARSTTSDVDAGYYWVFIRAKGPTTGYSNSDFEFIIVPEGESEPEPEPPTPPRVSGTQDDNTPWVCERDEYCYLFRYGFAVNGDGLDLEWEYLRPDGGRESGTSVILYTNIPLTKRGGLRARRRVDSASPWSNWSNYLWKTATAEDAARDSASSVPGALSNLFVTQESGGHRVSFTRGSHGGLPITHYEWRPTDAGVDCNGPGLPYQNLQALNDNLDQSFLVYGYGEELAIRARNAKGAGPCGSSPFPGRPPELQVISEWWTCSNVEYCFKTVIVDITSNTEYQVQIEERTPPSSTSEDWTREILNEGGSTALHSDRRPVVGTRTPATQSEQPLERLVGNAPRRRANRRGEGEQRRGTSGWRGQPPSDQDRRSDPDTVPARGARRFADHGVPLVLP